MERILNPKTLQKMVKIVSAVRKFTKKDEEYVRVHYTDGSEKIFNAFEWKILVKEGKDLWDSHQEEISQMRSDIDIDLEKF